MQFINNFVLPFVPVLLVLIIALLEPGSDMELTVQLALLEPGSDMDLTVQLALM